MTAVKLETEGQKRRRELTQRHRSIDCLQWFGEYHKAVIILAGVDGRFEWAEDAYVAFRFYGRDFTLVFYPHTTKSTGNQHIRVRTERGHQTEGAERAIGLLCQSLNSCTFNCKATRGVWPHHMELGWAQPIDHKISKASQLNLYDLHPHSELPQ